jgi:hypothetical protein
LQNYYTLRLKKQEKNKKYWNMEIKIFYFRDLNHIRLKNAFGKRVRLLKNHDLPADGNQVIHSVEASQIGDLSAA